MTLAFPEIRSKDAVVFDPAANLLVDEHPDTLGEAVVPVLVLVRLHTRAVGLVEVYNLNQTC